MLWPPPPHGIVHPKPLAILARLMIVASDLPVMPMLSELYIIGELVNAMVLPRLAVGRWGPLGGAPGGAVLYAARCR